MSNTVTIGKLDDGHAVKLDVARLLVTRLLITADSGGGKSYLLRKILEQVSRTTQTIVFDPEGEFSSLREIRDMVLAGPGGEVPAEPRSAGLLCRRLIELNTSAVIDLSELTIRQRQEFAKEFCETMVQLPRALWHDCFVVIDEAHEFAPEVDKSVSESAIASLSVKGRKRGYCLACATTRISNLSKNVAAGLKNKFLGTFSLDTDIKRAATDLGFGRDKYAEIRDLSSQEGHEGEFFCVGPALNRRGVSKMRGGEVETTHPTPGRRKLKPPEPSAKILGVLDELKDIPEQAEAEIRDLAAAKQKIAQQERELKRLAHAAPVAAVATHTTSRQDAQTITRLRKGLEEAMKVIAQIEAKGFDKVGISPEEISKALDAAKDQIVKLVQQKLTKTAQDYERFKADARKALAQLQKLIDADVTVSVGVQHNEPFTVSRPAPPARPAASTDDTISPAMLRILNSLAWWEVIGVTDPEKGIVAVMASYTVNGHFTNLLGALRTRGLIDYPGEGRVSLTDAGKSLASYPDTPGDLATLHAAWESKLSASQWKIIKPVIDAHPSQFEKEDLASASGYTVNGHFTNMLGSLRSLGIITKKGPIGATDLLFPPSLT